MSQRDYNVPVASPDGHKPNYLCLIKLSHRLPQLGHVAFNWIIIKVYYLPVL